MCCYITYVVWTPRKICSHVVVEGPSPLSLCVRWKLRMGRLGQPERLEPREERDEVFVSNPPQEEVLRRRAADVTVGERFGEIRQRVELVGRGVANGERDDH